MAGIVLLLFESQIQRQARKRIGHQLFDRYASLSRLGTRHIGTLLRQTLVNLREESTEISIATIRFEDMPEGIEPEAAYWHRQFAPSRIDQRDAASARKLPGTQRHDASTGHADLPPICHEVCVGDADIAQRTIDGGGFSTTAGIHLTQEFSGLDTR